MPSVNVITLKRSAVKGKVPTVSNLTSGELAINTRDGRLYSANTTQVFEIGSITIDIKGLNGLGNALFILTLFGIK